SHFLISPSPPPHPPLFPYTTLFRSLFHNPCPGFHTLSAPSPSPLSQARRRPCLWECFSAVLRRRPPGPCLEKSDAIRYVCRQGLDRKSTRLNSSHVAISYAVFCLKK